ncbi:uncharacterized protein [Rutidosis leptorrhynchoides]|uniref:uncharacterized protein n=1 Tax=Rutidosis leptorrhynchoides TaxID=125765 RepID=UPI003A99EA97
MCSGLTPSMPKSTACFCNVALVIKNVILAILPFEEDTLPVKYLGVPLVSSSLLHLDCKSLVDRVRCKIKDWKNRFLSFAGRVQLITSVITSMQVYWQCVFILPRAINMRGFLWCQGEFKRGKAKVKQSVWVRWIHEYRLKGTNFWNAPNVAGASVGWRKLLAIRKVVCNRFIFKIGDGISVSAWHDCWCDLGPLATIVSNRIIHSAGFNHHTVVRELVGSGGWNWPSNWEVLYPQLQNITPPALDAHPDTLKWRSYEGDLHDFSVNIAWHAIRNRANPVQWFSVVLFAKCIPKHWFLVWCLWVRD